MRDTMFCLMRAGDKVNLQTSRSRSKEFTCRLRKQHINNLQLTTCVVIVMSQWLPPGQQGYQYPQQTGFNQQQLQPQPTGYPGGGTGFLQPQRTGYAGAGYG